ncbi:MAG TPA: carboxypeptidase-like regulatory domain-containing protein, partial [Bryobacteraceae bacterium]
MSWKRFAFFLTTFAVASGCIFAQTTGATLQGTLNDPSDLAVPNQTVNLQNVATNAVRTAKTTAEGLFRFNALEPGVYGLTIPAAAGFQQYVVNQISLNVSETRDLGRIRLSLGSVTDSVSVTAATTP